MYFLQRVERLLDMPPGEKDAVLRELRSHYEEIRSQLEYEGVDEERAATEAEARLGDPTEVALTLNREHCVSSWKTAILTALPFLVMAAAAYVPHSEIAKHLGKTVGVGAWTFTYGYGPISFAHAASVLALAAFFLGGSVREIIRGRRPLWLSSWLPAGLLCGAGASAVLVLRAVSPDAVLHHASPIILCCFAALFAIPAASCWHIAAWRRYLVPAVALGIGCTVALTLFIPHRAGHNPPTAAEVVSLLGILLAMDALWIAFAVGTFQRHRYGGPVNATLFLFALLWIIGPRFNAGVDFTWATHWSPFPQIPEPVTCMFVASIAALAFARASTPRKKGRLLAWSAFLLDVAHLQTAWYVPTLIVVWIPDCIERRSRRKELERLASETTGGITT